MTQRDHEQELEDAEDEEENAYELGGAGAQHAVPG